MGPSSSDGCNIWLTLTPALRPRFGLCARWEGVWPVITRRVLGAGSFIWKYHADSKRQEPSYYLAGSVILLQVGFGDNLKSGGLRPGRRSSPAAAWL